MTPQAMPQAPDLPRHIAQQMAEALQKAGGAERSVDLMLNPAELGRVRISLSPGDAGLTVQIIADRPETLDLMRRNIDLLAQDFQSIGYAATDFTFAQHQGDSDQDGPAGNPGAPSQHPAQGDGGDTPPSTTALIQTDRVDIRL
jgi:flagellar hook-length control protein FliK